MSNVEFNEDHYGNMPPAKRPQKPVGGLTQLFIRMGVAKDASTAALLMLGVAALCLLTAVIIISRMNTTPEVEFDPTIDPETGLEYGIPAAI